MTYVIGLDLGQAQDYTALAIAEQVPQRVEQPRPRIENHYHIRHLERPPLGTKYTAIVEQVQALMQQEPLSPQTPLVVDKTGVGAGVVDMFKAADLYPRAITITGGDAV